MSKKSHKPHKPQSPKSSKPRDLHAQPPRTTRATQEQINTNGSMAQSQLMLICDGGGTKRERERERERERVNKEIIFGKENDFFFLGLFLPCKR